MDGRANTEDLRLKDLVELLELGQQFYRIAIPRSSSDAHRLRERSAYCYAVMLAEIRQWQARNDNFAGASVGPSTPSTFTAGPTQSSPPKSHVADNFVALQQRLYRIYRSSSFSTHRPSLGRASAQREDACVSADPVPGAEHGEPQLRRSHG